MLVLLFSHFCKEFLKAWQISVVTIEMVSLYIEEKIGRTGDYRRTGGTIEGQGGL